MSLKTPSTSYPTLYTPATASLDKINYYADGNDPFVRRMVICTEDSISKDDVPQGIATIRSVLEHEAPDSRAELFVRVRDMDVLKRVIDLPGVERLSGFVIPKAHPDTYGEYGDAIRSIPEHRLRTMPILESRGMGSPRFRADLLDTLADYHQQIECVRIGANDLMGNQQMRRDKTRTIYEVAAISSLIGNILCEFRDNGDPSREFAVTAPVFECIDKKFDKTLKKEVKEHCANNLFGQTMITPRHAKLLWKAYRVSPKDAADAVKLADANAAAVEKSNGRMLEPTTHHQWGSIVAIRQELFGINYDRKTTKSS